jgi:16S rRNA (cytidine1402-2'-O)-methyltransferase
MLYLVAVPIGNLGDITLRALETLEKVEVVLAEDTRNTQKLFGLLKIKNKPKMVSFYDQVEESRIPSIIELLKGGVEVALVTDAGTPLLSDPGWKLVKRCRELGLAYTGVPGACAAINALVLSGLPIGRFVFLGFLPKKSGERKKVLEKYLTVDGSKVVYESPYRVGKLVAEIKEVFGDKTEIRVIREMTKKFEEVLDPNSGLGNQKGEVCVVFI